MTMMIGGIGGGVIPPVLDNTSGIWCRADARCYACLSPLHSGTVYHCMTCQDFDLCSACYWEKSQYHGIHQWIYYDADLGDLTSGCMACKACGRTLCDGIAFHCKTCHNFDICESCKHAREGSWVHALGHVAAAFDFRTGNKVSWFSNVEL
ncbi:hypothetical protein BC937DRAFT_94959 [Endogone sp. FLAS-F59071]|nr:hypothetical protein BC937DRAFT_94959 [Endogone sp. FLAS-F59071]|eukprot:RUS13670.1 hypothetical protein BC937DRAFT_94959 [Endogone sp. FLAS-F59071]